MAIIGSLAPDTLLQIFELAAESDFVPTDIFSPLPRTLAAASLVARSWREAAQAQMWRHLCLDRHNLGEVLASPVYGKFRTAQAGGHMGAEMPAFDRGGTKIREVLKSLKGLETKPSKSILADELPSQWLNLASVAGASRCFPFPAVLNRITELTGLHSRPKEPFDLWMFHILLQARADLPAPHAQTWHLC